MDARVYLTQDDFAELASANALHIHENIKTVMLQVQIHRTSVRRGRLASVADEDGFLRIGHAI
jgi:hypothetical protein